MCVGSGAVVLLQPGCPRAGCKALKGLVSVILSFIAVDFKAFSFSMYIENTKKYNFWYWEDGAKTSEMTYPPARPGEHRSSGYPSSAAFQE